jgi:hypothetical protein
MSPFGMMMRIADMQGGADTYGATTASWWAGWEIIFDLAIYDGNTAWPGFVTRGMWDQREQPYALERMALCALYDPNPVYGGNSGKCKPAVATNFTVVWQAVHNQFSSYEFPAFNGNIGSHLTPNLSTYITATNGSNIITLNGGTWTSATLNGLPPGPPAPRIWLWNCSGTPGTSGGCGEPLLNTNGDPIVYTVTYVDSTHATISDYLGNPLNYQGTSGSHGWAVMTGLPQNLGWGTQPFMTGIQAAAMVMASNAMSDGAYNPSLAATYLTYAQGAASFAITYGVRATTKGLYYQVGSANCPLGAVPENDLGCTGSGSPANPDPSRLLSFEVIRGLMFYYLASGNSTIRSTANELVNAQFAKPGTCGSNPLCSSDGYYINDFDPGGSFVTGNGTSQPTYGYPKYTGQSFGMNPTASWPSMLLLSTTVNGLFPLPMPVGTGTSATNYMTWNGVNMLWNSGVMTWH